MWYRAAKHGGGTGCLSSSVLFLSLGVRNDETILLSLGLICLSHHSLYASIVTIDFESRQHSGTGANTIATYEEDGFKISGEVGTSNAFGTWGTSSDHFAGSTGMFGNVALHITLARADGGVFDLNTVDISHLFDTNVGNDRFVITFVGQRADSTTATQVINEPRFFGFQTRSLSGFNDLVSVTWDQSAFGSVPHQFDNISLAIPSPPPPVPEPTTLSIWSLLVGIGIVAGYRRGRRKAARTG